MGLLDWLFGKGNAREKFVARSDTETIDGEKYTWTKYNDGTWMMKSGPGEPWETYFREPL